MSSILFLSWPTQWIHGSNGEPCFQVHRVCKGLYAIRQSKLLNFEGNFMYLIVGEDRAMLVDTGAVDSADSGLVECIDNILFSLNRLSLPLVVAHSHSHGDHIQGDILFTQRKNTQIVGHGVEAVSQFYSLQIPSDDSSASASPSSSPDIASFDLGGERYLDVFFIPGHHKDHVAFYDRQSGVLLSGDFLYRGRLYVEDRAIFLRSVKWLDEFANDHPISAVLGAHIEMTSYPGVDYPDGTLFQPDEPPLSMDVSHIRTLRRVVERAAKDHPLDWGVIKTDDFIVMPTEAIATSASQSSTCTSCSPSTLTRTPLRIALLREVFFKTSDSNSDDRPSQQERLSASLVNAAALGAIMVVLPELPMDEWYPRMKSCVPGEVCEDGMDDERIVAMSESAKCAGVVLVGGALLRASALPPHLRDGVTGDDDPAELTHIRNVTLIFDKQGQLVATHMKRHLPKEEGFWEGQHFVAAPGIPSVKRGVLPGLLLGVQTCSDIMRPSAHCLAALGAGLIINPRATETASSAKWQRIVSGLAATTASYIISVPRPAPEGDLDLGGDAFVVSPTGDDACTLSSSENKSKNENKNGIKKCISICDLDLKALGEARVCSYPGYLDVRSDEYAAAWQQVSLLRRENFQRNFD